MTDDICAVTAFFNPANYRTRTEHYQLFRAALEEDEVTLYTVEGYFSGARPALAAHERLLTLELSSVMWHKERLLNLLVASLPKKYTKIVWLDCDVIFNDASWLEQTSGLLNTYSVVQCFDNVRQLAPRARGPRNGDLHFNGFVKSHLDGFGAENDGTVPHGRTGFAWAARRDFFDQLGLYDRGILGGADHVMAHAFAGDPLAHPCFLRESAEIHARLADFRRWVESARLIFNDGFHFVPVTLMHFWHGTLNNRRYAGRRDILTRNNFDPLADIEASPNGTWKWATDKAPLHQAVLDYFRERREDDQQAWSRETDERGSSKEVKHRPAARPVSVDICAVTAYFNPANYHSRKGHYELFRSALERSGIPLFTIEGYFVGTAPYLAGGERVVAVELSSLLWHKERLLNLLIASLPREYTKVAWLDCDVLFEDSEWLQRASEALDQRDVVQCFDDVVLLPPDEERLLWTGDLLPSFMKVMCADLMTFNSLLDAHGHTGFAWAARRELLDDVGLYDACVLGGGDHLMAHAFVGDLLDHECVSIEAGRGPARINHFELWRKRLRSRTRRGFGHLSGSIFHLWHGAKDDRQYSARREILSKHGFDPDLDLELGANGTWRWALDKPNLREEVERYFAQRREDGAPPFPNSPP